MCFLWGTNWAVSTATSNQYLAVNIKLRKMTSKNILQCAIRTNLPSVRGKVFSMSALTIFCMFPECLDRLCGPGYRSGFDSRSYQIFCEVVGLERGSLNLVSTIEELLEWKSSGSGLENLDYAVGIRHAGYATFLYTLKLVLSSPTSGGRSVGIYRSRTKDTELLLFLNS
jgi:hypothetical protein